MPDMNRSWTRYLALAGPVCLCAAWWLLGHSGRISPILLPTPESVVAALLSLLYTEHTLWHHLGVTTYRTLTAFSISCLLGIPLGLSMGLIPRVYKSCELLVDFFRSVPPIAFFPLFILTLGLDDKARIAVGVYGCTLVLVVNSVYGVLNAPTIRRTVAQTYGFSTRRIFQKIVVPDALPQIFVGMRTALSLALVLTIVVEMMIGSRDGLGKEIYEAHLLLESPTMYAAILTTGILGFVMNKALLLVERRVIHWADK